MLINIEIFDILDVGGINMDDKNIPEEYKPISMWGYFGYEILFAIPLVGFILLLVFSFGGTTNKNLRNFARSYFCFVIVGLIIAAITFGIMLMLGVTTSITSR